MPTSALRDRLSAALVEFAWDEWAQMGVFAPTSVRSRWAQDPEALILMTFEAGRYDPRLFDELLDWLTVNEALVSVRRLRTLCVDDDDRALVAAATDWLARRKGRKAAGPATRAAVERPLFHALPAPTRKADGVFADHGFLRPVVVVREQSSAPDPALPINLAFRLRHLLGTGARAEVVRALLTIDSPRISTADAVRTARYARQNVHDALASLRAAGVVSSVGSGSEQRYWMDRSRWAVLLGNESGDWPLHRDWHALLGALRTILRWLEVTPLDEVSTYMRGSLTRELLERVAPMVAPAGIVAWDSGTSAEAPAALARIVDRALEMLDAEGATAHQPRNAVPPRAARVRVEANDHGKHVWFLRAANGRSVARSMEAYDTEEAATDAAWAFVDRVAALDFDFADRGDGIRWRAAASDGVVVALSVDTFSSRSNARRAVAHVRKLLDDAPLVREPAR